MYLSDASLIELYQFTIALSISSRFAYCRFAVVILVMISSLKASQLAFFRFFLVGQGMRMGDEEMVIMMGM